MAKKFKSLEEYAEELKELAKNDPKEKLDKIIAHRKNELDKLNKTIKELDIKGSRNSVNAFPLAIKWLNEKQLDLESVISDIIDFTEIPIYIKKIAENPNDYLKVVAIFK